MLHSSIFHFSLFGRTAQAKAFAPLFVLSAFIERHASLNSPHSTPLDGALYCAPRLVECYSSTLLRSAFLGAFFISFVGVGLPK